MFTFEQVFAADPSNPSNIAQNAAITIFAPGDGTMTPLTITDPDGAPLANPLTVNANGFASAFAHATLDRVAWAGGGFTGFFTSYEGMKAEATAARTAAEAAAATAGADAAVVATAAIGDATAEAEAAATAAASAQAAASASATAAANSAALVGAPADTAIAAAVNGTGATKTALNATYVPSEKDAGDTFKVVTRRQEFNDLAGGKGSQLNFNHRADGTGNTENPGQTYAVDIHNHVGAKTALVVHQYSSVERAVQIDNTGTQPSLEINNTENQVLNPGSVGTGDFIMLRDHGTMWLRLDKDLVFRVGSTKVVTFLHTAAKALSVQTASTFNGEAMDVTKAGTGSGTALKVNNSGTGAGLQINQAGAGRGLQIDANAAGNAGQYGALIQGYDYASSITTAADGGVTSTITKNGTAGGVAQQIVNKGTGNSLEVRSASAQTFTVAAGGFISVIQGTSVNVLAGTGSPEGAKSAPVGSVFLRSDGGAGTSFYVKETGTGNTGWVAK